MRIRVSYEALQFVHVVREETVGELMQTLSQRVGTITGALAPGDSGSCHLVRELCLAPSYALEAEQGVADVLRDDDSLVAVTEADYLKREAALCAAASTTLSRKDLATGQTVSLEVGIHAYNRVYARVRVGRALVRLETISRAFAHELPSAGDYLVYEHSGTTKGGDSEECTWCASVTAVVKKDDTGALAVTAVLSSLRVSTDPQPEIWRIPVHLTNGKMALSDHSVHQQALVDWLESLQDRDIPESTRTGPALLPEKIPRPATVKPFEENVVHGLEHLKLVQNEETFVQQGRSSQEGCFAANYWCDFQCFVDGDAIIISKVAAEYKDKEGKWVACSSCSLGAKRGFAYYCCYDGATTFPSGASTVALHACIDGFKLPQGQHERITPLSLPQPMELRFTLTTPNDKAVAVTVQQVNNEIEIKPAAPAEDELVRAACDEHNSLSRMFITVRKETARSGDSDYLAVSVNGRGGKYLYYSDLLTLAHRGIGEQTAIVTIDDLSSVSKPDALFQYSCCAVVDQERGYCYALKLWVKSATAEVTEYIRIPPLAH